MTGLVDNVEKLAEDAFRKAGNCVRVILRSTMLSVRCGSRVLTSFGRLPQKATGANAATLKTQNAESLTKAEEAFKRAIEKSSTYGLAIYNLGAVYDRQDKVKEAIMQLEKIAPYNANQPTLMFELGLLYIRNEQKDNAVAAMQRAVLLAPQYANARWYLALLLEERDDVTRCYRSASNEIQKNNHGQRCAEAED